MSNKSYRNDDPNVTTGKVSGVQLPSDIISPRKMQAIRERLMAGETLSAGEALRFLSSHERLRACCLVARHRVVLADREVADLHTTIRRLEVQLGDLLKMSKPK